MALRPQEIPTPQTSRDPGVSARPVRRSGALGQALQNAGNTMGEIAQFHFDLQQKRQEAEDDRFVDAFRLEAAKRFTNIEQNSRANASDPDFVDSLDSTLSSESDSIIKDLQENRGLTVSESGLEKVRDIEMGLRTKTASRSVVRGHNERLSLLTSNAADSVEVEAREVFETGEVEAGLERVEETADTLKGVLSPEKHREFKRKARESVVEQAVRGHIEREEFQRARELERRYIGFAKDDADTTTKTIFSESERVGVDPVVLTAIAKLESGLDPDAKNPKSSAAGLFQFLSRTGTEYGLPADARKASPAAQARAGARFTADNIETLRQGLGDDPTPGEVYLAHFFGAGTAVRVLNANPDTKVSALVSEKVMDANPHLENMTVNGVVDWASTKMQKAMEGVEVASREVEQDEALLPIRTAARLHEEIDEGIKNQIRKDELLSGRMVADPGSKEDRDIVDQATQVSGVNEQILNQNPTASEALTGIVKSTGIVPDSSLSNLRSMAINGTPEAREFALQTTAQLIREKPGVLDNKRGAADLRDDARLFESFVIAGGLPPQEALNRVDQTKTEEFRRNRGALEQQANNLADDLTPETITQDFDTIFSIEPSLGATKVRGQVMFSAFKENFKFHYIKTGDPNIARDLALKDVRKAYDVSSVTGENRLMKHPPEKYYPAVDESFDYIGKQLKADVKERAGKAVPLENIYVEAVPQTDADIRAGRPPRYGVSWLTEDETLDTAPDMVWRPDLSSEKARVAKERKRRFELIREQAMQREVQAGVGGELGLIETRGADPEDIEARRRRRERALERAVETGALF